LATDVECTLGAVAAKGYNATICLDTAVNCTLPFFWVTGRNATVLAGIDINCTLGQAACTGFNATVPVVTGINCTLGQAACTGFDALVETAVTAECTLGQVACTGFNADVEAGIISIELSVNAVGAGTGYIKEIETAAKAAIEAFDTPLVLSNGETLAFDVTPADGGTVDYRVTVWFRMVKT